MLFILDVPQKHTFPSHRDLSIISHTPSRRVLLPNIVTAATSSFSIIPIDETSYCKSSLAIEANVICGIAYLYKISV